MESGHTSVLEHANFTFYIEGVSRVLLAQLTRHRLASYSVESQRYVKMSNVQFVIPESILSLESDVRDFAIHHMTKSLFVYEDLIESGVPAEDARYILPQAVPTKLYLTMNARELLHFFSLRTCNRAQWEIRELAKKMLKLCKSVAPELFKKAGPGCVTGNCPEKRSCGNPQTADNLLNGV